MESNELKSKTVNNINPSMLNALKHRRDAITMVYEATLPTHFKKSFDIVGSRLISTHKTPPVNGEPSEDVTDDFSIDFINALVGLKNSIEYFQNFIDGKYQFEEELITQRAKKAIERNTSSKHGIAVWGSLSDNRYSIKGDTLYAVGLSVMGDYTKQKICTKEEFLQAGGFEFIATRTSETRGEHFGDGPIHKVGQILNSGGTKIFDFSEDYTTHAYRNYICAVRDMRFGREYSIFRTKGGEF